MANKAYKFRVYPTTEQAILLNKTFGCSRFIYNNLLADKTAYYKKTGKPLKKEVSEYKVIYPFLKEVDSLALANAKLHIETAFINFFKKRAKYPQFHKKGLDDSYTTNNVNGNIMLITENGYTGIKLPKVGVVKIKQHRQIGKDETIKSVTVSCKGTKYFVSILVYYDNVAVIPVDPKDVKEDKVIGIDYSSPLFYVDSNGHSPMETKYFRKSQAKLAKLQKRLSKKKYKSNNYYKQLAKVQGIHDHIANQRKDFAYKEANRLTNSYDIICFEDLNLSNLKRTLKLGKATSDNGFGFFRSQVERKCKERGKLFVKVDKWYPSSKTCHYCGTKNPDLKLSDREWVCPHCKSIVSRDVNAAINIRYEGLRLALKA